MTMVKPNKMKTNQQNQRKINKDEKLFSFNHELNNIIPFLKNETK